MLRKIFFYGGFWTIVLLPLYGLRVQIGDMSVGSIDIAMLILLGVGSVVVYRQNWMQMKQFLGTHRLFISAVSLLCLGVILSLGAHPSRHGLGIVLSWVFMPLGVILLFRVILSFDERIRWVYAYFLSALGVSFVAIGFLFLGEMTYDGRLKAWYLSPNHLALYIYPAVLVGMVVSKDLLRFFLPKASSLTRAVCGWVSLGSMIFVLYSTFSYGAWGAVFFGGMLYIFLAKKKQGECPSLMRKIALKIGVSVFVLGSVFALQVSSEKFQALITWDERSSFASRMMIWKSAWDISVDNWFLGIGAGNFQEQYLEYQQYYPPYLEWAVPLPHNLYLTFWLYGGVLGLIGFIAMMGTWIWKKRFVWLYSKRVYPPATRDKGQKKQEYAILAFIVITSFLLYGLIDTPFWKNDLSVLFWLFLLL